MKRSNNNSSSLGVRKGAWTAEEDHLLRKCIQKYGEGKWHQVPPRAGLNRCRKSCRLRWLNYLRPDIKRGLFAGDEEDLIIRLHKLFGNRWSLIAGRIPGRTANDVKNYWNTHMQKKILTRREGEKSDKITKATIIKPRPRTFPRNTTPCVEGKTVEESVELITNNDKLPLPMTSPPPPATNDDNVMEWWANLFAQQENSGEAAGPLSFNFPDEMNLTNGEMNPTNENEAFDVTRLWSSTHDEIVPTNEVGYPCDDFFKEDGQKEWNSELSVDINMWDL